MTERALHVVDAEIVAADGRTGWVTFAEVWPDHFVLHAVIERRMSDELGGAVRMLWAYEDEAGTMYQTRRAGSRLRDEWWSTEVVVSPLVPASVRRLTVTIPQLDARVVIDVGSWPAVT
jgi:hypothetical protein